MVNATRDSKNLVTAIAIFLLGSDVEDSDVQLKKAELEKAAQGHPCHTI